MIKITTVIQYKGHPEAKRRALSAAVRAALMDLGVDWGKKLLPLHFEVGAYRRYSGDYQKRSAKYNKAKGHSKPMVKTGAMRRQILSFLRVKPSTKKVRVTMSGVRALNFSSRANYPDFKAELTATSPSERNDFAKKLDAGITRRLNAVKTPSQFRAA